MKLNPHICSPVTFVLCLTAHSLPQSSLSKQSEIYAGHTQLTFRGFPESSYTGNTGRVTQG